MLHPGVEQLVISSVPRNLSFQDLDLQDTMKGVIAAAVLLLGCTSCAAIMPKVSGRTCITGPQQPAEAAAAGFNCLVFYDDFTSESTIDRGITNAPGFNWYPGAILGGGSEPSSDYSVFDSVLTISTQPTPGGAPGLHTIVPTSPTNYVGHTFHAPFYIEYKIATNRATAPGETGTAPCGIGGSLVTRYGWPTVWMEDATMVLAKTNQTNLSGKYAEIDGPYEFYVGCNGEESGEWSPEANVHYWTNWNAYNAGCTNTIMPSGTWSDTTFHVTGALIKTMARGDGTGSVTFYQDGSQIARCTWTSGQPLQSVEKAHFVVFLNSGIGWALHVDYVGIWVP